MSKLLPCPFCGCSAKIAQCDDEGNVRGEEYESNPWSGLGYRIVHESDDCPISTGEDGYNLIYDSREEAVNDWNTRAERTCHIVPMDAAGNPPYRTGNLMLNALSDGCSECGYPFDTLNHGVPNYCPNCGAKVVE